MRCFRPVLLLLCAACGDATGPRPPAALELVDSRELRGVVGAELAQPVIVRVTDANGAGVHGSVIEWTVLSGGGRFAQATTTTDAAGTAQNRWTLGTTPGENRAMVRVSGLPALTLSARAEAGAVATLAVAPDPFTLTLGTVARLAAIARDAFGNLIERPVRWSTSDAAVATVDSTGFARGIRIGAAQLTAELEGKSASARVTVARPIQTLGAGFNHACAIATNGETLCWGLNSSGQLGNGTTANSSVPVAVATAPAFVTISAGFHHSCGLTADGSASCWGRGDEGQLGQGANTSSSVPAAVAGGLRFAVLSAGTGVHTCGITLDGAGYCWGANHLGQLGTGGTTPSAVPVRVAGGETFVALHSGASHNCGVTQTGALLCWGANFFGELGNGTTAESAVPVPVITSHVFTTVGTGSFHSCGITFRGDAYCWGNNSNGQLGNGRAGASTSRTTPDAVVGSLTLVSVSGGEFHTCALASGGAGYCWGQKGFGALGNGDGSSSSVPVAVLGGLTFRAVTSGGFHTCGLATTGEAYCWGWNRHGQLGTGNTVDATSPVRVTGLSVRLP